MNREKDQYFGLNHAMMAFVTLIAIFAMPIITLAQTPEIPHIDSVEMAEVQPVESDPGLIWYDDFSTAKPYYDSAVNRDYSQNYGDPSGASLECYYAAGSRGTGNCKAVFGDCPIGGSYVVRPGETFDDVYVRLYVKHQYGWQGGSPAKMARTTMFVCSTWGQGMINHCWGYSALESLLLDPVRMTVGSTAPATSYNQWEYMHWLGWVHASFPISSTDESGYWVMVEYRTKLNTPGTSDGAGQIWIDGRLEGERHNFNFRDTYIGHGINAVFFEAYWNDGSPVNQSRWYDNITVSTNPIGPMAAPSNPTLYKTSYHGPESLNAWEVEVASDYNGTDVVYQSNTLGATENVVVNSTNGSFCGSSSGKSKLTQQVIYYCRVKQQSTNGQWSNWSRWHQGFIVDDGEAVLTANAGPDQSAVDSDGDGYETVTLDGTASTPGEGHTIIAYAWYDGEDQIATGAEPQISLPLGIHEIELRVLNDVPEMDTDSVQISVVEPGVIISDTVSSAATSEPATSLTWSHTYTGVANSMIIVGVAGEDQNTSDLEVSGVTYNGTSMSYVPDSKIATSSTTMTTTQLYILPKAMSPTTPGDYDVTITFNGEVDSIIGGAVTLGNVEQEFPEAVATNTVLVMDTTTPISTDITVITPNAWILDFVASAREGTFTSTNPDMTELFDTANTNQGAACSTLAPELPGLVTMSWTTDPAPTSLAHSVAVFCPCAPPAVQAGDYNGDGTVDQADYTVWADSYGDTGSNLPADGNNDGTIDQADYTVWADHYGETLPEAPISSGLNSMPLLVSDEGAWQDDPAAQATPYAVSGLVTLGGRICTPTAINDTGQIVGSSTTKQGIEHAFIFAGDTITDLGTLGGTWSKACDINANGTVVGSSLDTRGFEKPFIYSNGTMTELGTLAGLAGQALSINDNDVVVGWSNDIKGNPQAVVFEKSGQVTDLNSLLPDNSNWILLRACSITNNGKITGKGICDNQLKAFMISLPQK